MKTLAHQARHLYAEAMRTVDVRRTIAQHVLADAATLTLADSTIPLDSLDQVLVCAIGKAALPMYAATAEALANAPLPHRAVVVAPEMPAVPAARRSTDGVLYCRGAHPTPEEHSLHAADAMLALLATATSRTAVLFLISGGASAMIERPLDPKISLAETAAFHRALVSSGLTITRMNTLRKHFSAVKGGRLALAAAVAAVQATLLISDVPSAAPDAIGSGPSMPDSTTLDDVSEILRSSRLDLPPSVAAFFRSPLCVETPKADHEAFSRAQFRIVLSSEHLAEAAAATARKLGFHTVIDNACDEFDYREAAAYLLDKSAGLAHHFARTCLISTGEVSVPLTGDPGQGGRNQQFALFAAMELARGHRRAVVLSAGSDGIDGNSAAAGAACDETTAGRAAQLGLDAATALSHFNAAPLLRAVGDDIVTGPSGNNLRDLRLILTDDSESV